MLRGGLLAGLPHTVHTLRTRLHEVCFKKLAHITAHPTRAPRLYDERLLGGGFCRYPPPVLREGCPRLEGVAASTAPLGMCCS
jgi:hypothetical protein